MRTFLNGCFQKEATKIYSFYIFSSNGYTCFTFLTATLCLRETSTFMFLKKQTSTIFHIMWILWDLTCFIYIFSCYFSTAIKPSNKVFYRIKKFINFSHCVSTHQISDLLSLFSLYIHFFPNFIFVFLNFNLPFFFHFI